VKSSTATATTELSCSLPTSSIGQYRQTSKHHRWFQKWTEKSQSWRSFSGPTKTRAVPFCLEVIGTGEREAEKMRRLGSRVGTGISHLGERKEEEEDGFV
jgi:hypothetical protein